MPDIRRANLPALTSLRFFAALCIVVLHATNHGLLPAEWAHQVDLSKAVSFFFVLSGFVLTYAYHGRSFTLRRFYLSRWARVWPAAALSILMVPLLLPRDLYLPGQHGSWPEGVVMLASLLGLQAWIPIPAVFFGLNAVTWSISVEIGFYLLFPWLQSRTARWPAICLALCMVLSLSLGLIAAFSGIPGFSAEHLEQVVWQGVVYINPVARLFEFCIGIVAAQWFVSDQGEFWIARFRAIAATWPKLGTGVEAFVLGLLVVVPLRLLPTAGVLPTPLQLVINQLLTGVIFAGLIVAAAISVGRIGQFFNWKPFVFLGEVSYGLYLYHQPLMIRAAQAGGLKIAGIQLLPEAFLPVLAWSLAISTLSWAAVERPVVAAFRGRRSTSHCSQVASPEAPNQPSSLASTVCANPVCACSDTRTHL